MKVKPIIDLYSKYSCSIKQLESKIKQMLNYKNITTLKMLEILIVLYISCICIKNFRSVAGGLLYMTHAKTQQRTRN